MSLFRRSPRLAKLIVLEADNARLRTELEQAYKLRNLAWTELEELRRVHRAALAALRSQMLARISPEANAYVIEVWLGEEKK